MRFRREYECAKNENVGLMPNFSFFSVCLEEASEEEGEVAETVEGSAAEEDVPAEAPEVCWKQPRPPEGRREL